MGSPKAVVSRCRETWPVDLACWDGTYANAPTALAIAKRSSTLVGASEPARAYTADISKSRVTAELLKRVACHRSSSGKSSRIVSNSLGCRLYRAATSASIAARYSARSQLLETLGLHK